MPLEYLAELRAACPTPGTGHWYGQMVLEASLARRLHADASNLRERAEARRHHVLRMTLATGADPAGDPFTDGLAAQAAAMEKALALFDPDSTVAPVMALPDGITRARKALLGTSAETARAAEAVVLAALIQRHGESRRLMRMLSA
jgi:hypothetical protein